MKTPRVIIYLEDHTSKCDIVEDIRARMRTDEPTCLLLEATPCSQTVAALKELRNDIKNELVQSYSHYNERAERSVWFWRERFRRAYSIVLVSELYSSRFKIRGVDPRLNYLEVDRFKEEDDFFNAQVAQKESTFSPSVFSSKVRFFEEHAFSAWFVREAIQEEMAKGYTQFIYSTGSLHFASLVRYLSDLDAEVVFIRLPTLWDNEFRVMEPSEPFVREHLAGGDKGSDAYHMYKFFLRLDGKDTPSMTFVFRNREEAEKALAELNGKYTQVFEL